MIAEIIKNKTVKIEGDLAKIFLGNQYDIPGYNDFIALKEHLPTYDFEYEGEEPYLTTDKINLDIHDFDLTGEEDYLDLQEWFVGWCHFDYTKEDRAGYMKANIEGHEFVAEFEAYGRISTFATAKIDLTSDTTHEDQPTPSMFNRAAARVLRQLCGAIAGHRSRR